MLSYIKYNLFFSIYTFQNVLLNKIITVNISNLPSNIQKHDSHFAIGGKCPHVSEGPIDPNPGPIFPREEADAVNEVIRSCPNNENRIEDTTKINI